MERLVYIALIAAFALLNVLCGGALLRKLREEHGQMLEHAQPSDPFAGETEMNDFEIGASTSYGGDQSPMHTPFGAGFGAEFEFSAESSAKLGAEFGAR